jgi:hypothetical protein
MAMNEIKAQRFSVSSFKDFRDVVAALEAAIGHPEMGSFSKNIAAAKTFAEVEKDRARSDWPVGANGVYAS